MDKRTERLMSGHSYSLYDFMGGNRVIVIPDLQRDYCWTETKVSREDNPSLVQCYLDDLIKASADEGAEMKMGLLYGYEYPRDSVQLCDGQQRLTTLFLICGVCALRMKQAEELDDYSLTEEDKKMLAQAKEILSADKASRLQYGVRDSTLSFLNNLVESGAFKANVDGEDWFAGEYAKDPSVRNIVLALNQIDAKVDGAAKAVRLLRFILHKISFLYFDMQNREYSEEQYVILNTTGKLLTPTEHIKPKLLGKLADDSELLDKYSDKWESWEQFIWEHRPDDENFTVDEWFDRLLKIFYLAKYASVGREAGEEVKNYTTYQRILQGSIKYAFPQESKEEVLRTLDEIDRFFEVARFIDKNRVAVSTGLSDKDGKIPEIGLWDYIGGDRWANLSNLQQVVAVFCVLRKVRANELATTSGLLPLCKRVLDFAWVQAQYLADNQDVAKFLAFIDSIDLNGESIYKAAQSDDMFSAGLKEKKFVLLSDVANLDEVGPLELALMRMSHLQISKGRISYLFYVLDEISADNLNILCQNLVKTTENVGQLLRRALMTYGVYYLGNGRCSWGDRYDFAYSTNFFYDQLHKADAPRRGVVESFIRDIALKGDVIDYLKNRLKACRPMLVGDEKLDKVLELIYDNERYFKNMYYGRLAINGSRAMAMAGSSKSNGDIRIIDNERWKMLDDTLKLLSADGNWGLEYGFTLRRWYELNIDANDSIWIRVSGDYHCDGEGRPEFRPYVNISWKEKHWALIKESLEQLYPEKNYVDEKKEYIHLPIIKQPTVEEVAQIMRGYYSRLSELRLP